MALSLCVFMCVCAYAVGFNVDIPSRVVYKGNENSMFGFTVQAHIDGDQKMILVGAPEDERYPPRDYNISRPGAVYRCEPARRAYSGEAQGQRLHRCQEMVFDRKFSNIADKQGRQIEEKSHQWFGATLTSTGRNGPIVNNVGQREIYERTFKKKKKKDLLYNLREIYNLISTSNHLYLRVIIIYENLWHTETRRESSRTKGNRKT